MELTDLLALATHMSIVFSYFSEINANFSISEAIQVLSSLANSAMKKRSTFQIAPSSLGNGFDKTTDQVLFAANKNTK